MKKTILILSYCMLSYIAFGQCPEGDIAFDSQQDIDDFAVNYPNCSYIQGSVYIGAGSDFFYGFHNSDITDLSALNQITSIDGNLQIGRIVCDMESHDNPELISLSGLENLTTIGGSLSIELNSNLTDLSGLEGLTSIGGQLQIGGSALTSLNGLNNLESVQGVTLYTLVFGCGNIFEFYITGNYALTSLSGLENLQTLDNLSISRNGNLSACNEPFICNFIENGGNAMISNNAPGCNNTAEVLNSCSPTCTEQDSLVLVSLYNTTNGANWNTTWNLTQPISTWHGITMSANGCNVQELNLSNNNLVGTIPSEIGELSILTRLLLHTNSLSGSIPTTIGDLSELRQIWLFSNQLSGQLPPEIGNLSKLTHLGISSNNLIGNVPSSIGNLYNLIYLGVQVNQLSGCLDENLLNLCGQLESHKIDAGNNFDALWDDFCNSQAGMCSTERMIDSLALVAFYHATNGPNWYRQWDFNQTMDTWEGIELSPNGRVLKINIYANNQSGYIPPEIGDLTELILLAIGPQYYCTDFLGGSICIVVGSQIGGNIPPELGKLIKLESIILLDNLLYGSIPPELGNLDNLALLWLTSNQLSGCFDDNLSNICASASDVRINYGNNFDASWSDFCMNGAGSCSIPPTTCTYLDSLILIDLYNATNGTNWTNTWNLSQPISTWHGLTLSDNDCVEQIDLSNNNLVGVLPSSIGQLSTLLRLYLYNNQLSGNIPATIGDLTTLQHLWLFTNQMSGVLPPEIGNLTNLTHIGIDNNQFTGSIPATYGNLNNLIHLGLKNNQLSGCYDANLLNICYVGDNSTVNYGNNFSASWSNFCSMSLGCCECRLGDDSFDETVITLYPNPAENILHIADTHQRPIQQLSIFDMNGKIIRTIKNPSNSIHVSGIAQGIYLVKVTIEGGTVYRKIIIER